MVNQFKNAMLTSAIICREDIIADGQIHRFANHGKGKKDGWYVFHGMAGAFGDWSRGIHEKWSVGNLNLTPVDQTRLQRQQKEAWKTAEAERHRNMRRLQELQPPNGMGCPRRARLPIWRGKKLTPLVSGLGVIS